MWILASEVKEFATFYICGWKGKEQQGKRKLCLGDNKCLSAVRSSTSNLIKDACKLTKHSSSTALVAHWGGEWWRWWSSGTEEVAFSLTRAVTQRKINKLLTFYGVVVGCIQTDMHFISCIAKAATLESSKWLTLLDIFLIIKMSAFKKRVWQNLSFSCFFNCAPNFKGRSSGASYRCWDKKGKAHMSGPGSACHGKCRCRSGCLHKSVHPETDTRKLGPWMLGNTNTPPTHTCRALGQ